MSQGTPIPLEEYFAGYDESRALYDAVLGALEMIGDYEQRVTESQVAFRRRIGFAWVWVPAKYLRGDHAPLILTIGLLRRDGSPRWKQIVEPRPGRWPGSPWGAR